MSVHAGAQFLMSYIALTFSYFLNVLFFTVLSYTM